MRVWDIGVQSIHRGLLLVVAVAFWQIRKARDTAGSMFGSEAVTRTVPKNSRFKEVNGNDVCPIRSTSAGVRPRAQVSIKKKKKLTKT